MAFQDQKQRSVPASERSERKASGLSPREAAPDAGTSRSRVRGHRTASDAKDSRRRTAIWVDLLLILLLVGIVAGCIFGYRAFKSAYVPEWEDRNVIYVVEFAALDAEILPTYWNLDAPLYINDGEHPTPIGYLVEVPYIATLPADPEAPSEVVYKTMRFVLRAPATYREGKGYFCGDTPLLAGSTWDLRLDGIAASGTVLSVMEAEEYESMKAAEAADAADAP